ncbi:MAG: hypothetical protein ACKO5Q_21400, partial [Microcystaceae cyanobacterium]
GSKNPYDYKARVIKGAQSLVELGIRPDGRSTLLESVEEFLAQRREKEIELYGHVRTKEEILEEIKEVDARLNELREQDPELYDRNPSKQQILEEIETTNQEIAQLEQKREQVAKRIAVIRAQKGLK